MNSQTSLDNPAEEQGQDIFNRWPFSQRLAATIVNLDTSKGAPVLGLFGSWGSGKSTLLNFLRRTLEKDYADKVCVFTFNPWLFTDTGALLQDFFIGLARNIGVSDSKESARAGDLLASYGLALGMIPVVGQGLSRTIEAISKDLKDDPIQDKRDRLIEAMRWERRTVVVLIDDLDRVDREEVMAVLKLVRLVANFPKITYLLAFDDRRVASLAGQGYGDPAEGRHFLEKVVQYPFTLPAISQDRLRAYVVDRARDACIAARVVLGQMEWAFVDSLAGELVRRLIRTPRQAIRYGNALRFALPLLKGEVDPLDQMIVEAIRLLVPELYSYLAGLERIHEGSLDNDRNSFGERLGLGATERHDALALARLLFRPDLPSAKPLSDRRYFDRVFSYAVASDDVSDDEIGGLVEIASGPDQAVLDAKISGLMASRSASLVERLHLVTGGLGRQPGRRLATALTRAAHLVPNRTPMVHSDECAKLAKLIAGFVRHMAAYAAERDSRFVVSVLDAAAELPFARLLCKSLLEKGGEDGAAFAAQNRDLLLTSLAARIAAEAEAEPLYARFARLDALDLLLQWEGIDSAAERSWLEQRLATYPAEAETFILLFSDQDINYRYITRLAAAPVIIEALMKHFADMIDDHTENSEGITAARSFMQAHDRRTREEDGRRPE